MEEQLKAYHQIFNELYQMLKTDSQTVKPNTEYLEVIVGRYVAFEQKWKYTPYWHLAGKMGAAVIEEIERIWKEIREEHNEQNS